MNYNDTLNEAKKRFQELASQREIIDREMQALLRIIEGAQIVIQPADPALIPSPTGSPDSESLGVTKAIRLVLTRSRVPLLPTEIREALEGLGVEASSPKILLIHVHNVLRRLFESGEIEQVPRDGKIAYRALTAGDLLGQALRAHPIGALFGATANLRKTTSETKKDESK